MKSLHTSILGEDYEVRIGEHSETGLTDDLTGRCAYLLKTIDIEHSMRGVDTERERDMRTTDTIAHEVFHAFVHESGLNLSEEDEEKLAVWYGTQWRRLNNVVLEVLDTISLVDNV